ncbi:hypothetical protein [Luteimonas sp. MC1750]|uniref:hypothetical protein n=1 Tax=Luteimonas sp. MC1750 TaxID=2799326 RepID=UPI0018F0F905|nr:hypothetical protein [Luteimonas sp. MC1750]MBJ6985746.1 hypothetical protein [Luteimonas sp. MC1750]QQO05913.1 hypothetical protein JGR68_00150 [Luteimonas sp. MC1750]
MKDSHHLKASAKRFMGVGPSFGLLGIFFTIAIAFDIGPLSKSADRAAQEMLALNALALVAIAAMFFTGLVSTILGRPTDEWGVWRRRVFHYFSTRPAEFVADFAAPMFWFFFGAGVVMACAGVLDPLQILVFVAFLLSLVVLGFVAILYVDVLHSKGISTGWRPLRSGRLIGALLLAGSLWLVYLLPVVPKSELGANNALKPTPHRGANHVAGKACHMLHAPLRRGLA